MRALRAVSRDEATELENALIHAVLLEIRRHPFGGGADGGADSCLDSIRMRQDGSKPRAASEVGAMRSCTTQDENVRLGPQG